MAAIRVDWLVEGWHHKDIVTPLQPQHLHLQPDVRERRPARGIVG